MNLEHTLHLQDEDALIMADMLHALKCLQIKFTIRYSMNRQYIPIFSMGKREPEMFHDALEMEIRP